MGIIFFWNKISVIKTSRFQSFPIIYFLPLLSYFIFRKSQMFLLINVKHSIFSCLKEIFKQKDISQFISDNLNLIIFNLRLIVSLRLFMSHLLKKKEIVQPFSFVGYIQALSKFIKVIMLLQSAIIPHTTHERNFNTSINST